MTTTYVHAFTEYEVEANERDHAKHAQRCNECSLTGNEVNPYDQQSETYSHIFTAAPGAPAAKIERRTALDAEIAFLEAEICALKHTNDNAMVEIAAAKTKRDDALAAKTKRRAELDAEIAALMVEIATAKIKRNNKLAAIDAEIAALEAEIAAHRRH